MPWYKAGTVSVALNSNAVTGSGTAFIVNCRVGDAFRGPDGGWYEIINVASDTALAIDPPYQGASEATGAYALAPMQGYVKDSADQLRAIVNTYGAKLAALGTTGNYDVLPVSKGGTGGTTEIEVRNSLGLGAVATEDVVPVAKGGTGGTTQASARDGLGLGAVATDNVVPVARGGTGVTTLANLLTALQGAGAYSRANGVGTVSQSGGVPTGAIAERGSNANGEFVKLLDGTMAAWVTGRSLTFGNASNLSYAWTFPASFSEEPTVLPQLDLTNFATKIYSTTKEVYKRNVTTTVALLGLASAAQWVSGDQSLVTIGAIAVGRWY
jgi:hypothetical protein